MRQELLLPVLLEDYSLDTLVCVQPRAELRLSRENWTLQTVEADIVVAGQGVGSTLESPYILDCAIVTRSRSPNRSVLEMPYGVRNRQESELSRTLAHAASWRIVHHE